MARHEAHASTTRTTRPSARSVREFLDREVRPHLEEHLADKALGREFWLAAGKQGFLGLEVPEEYGGAGAGDYRFNAVLLEELSHVNAALSSCVGIHADIVAPYLVELTTEEQRERWLPGVASGELLTAIGMTEPSGGSDLAALKTTAVKDGDSWVHQRVQDVHHQRLLRRPRRGRGPHRAGEEGPRHHAVRRRHHRRRATRAAASSTRSARRSPTPPSCSSRTSGSATTTSSASSTTASST